MTYSKRVVGLDVVRTAAILLVLFTHFTIAVSVSGTGALVLRFLQVIAGFYGVELFFVLSGFLIGGILIRQYLREGFSQASLFPFWVRRWFRTLPAYWLFLLVEGVYARYGGHRVPWVTHLLFVQNFAAYQVDNAYGISWSLAIEEWMYLLLPLVLLLWHRLTRGRHETALLLTLGTFLVVPLCLRAVLGAHLEFDWGIRKVVLFRLDAIAVGVGLAYLAACRPAWFALLARRRLLAVGLVGLMGLTVPLLPVVRQGDCVLSPCLNVFLLPAVDVSCALVVAYCATLAGGGGRGGRFFVRVSTLAYSLYLFHTLVLTLVRNRLENLPLPPMAHAMLVAGLSLVVSFAVAEGVYRFYEKPLTDVRDRFRRAGRGAPDKAAAVPEHR